MRRTRGSRRRSGRYRDPRMHIPGAEEEGAAVRRGRLEVWYDTVTDPVSGTGFWLHHEMVSPTDGSAAYAHGWAAAFPPGEPPVLQRFGPGPPAPGSRFACGDVLSNRGRREGSAGPARWSLTHTQASVPLYTFGRAAWNHHLLPASQYLPFPTERFTGTIAFGDRIWELRDAPGGAARIRGHGNATRWGWLHADLGEGDVLEIVAAVGHRAGIDRLRPLPALRLRVARRRLAACPAARRPAVQGRPGAARVDRPGPGRGSAPPGPGQPAEGLIGLGRLSRPRRRQRHLREQRGGRRGGRPRASERRPLVDRAPVVAAGDGARRDRHPPVALAATRCGEPPAS